MNFLYTLLLVSLSIIFYNYIGYSFIAAFLILISRKRNKPEIEDSNSHFSVSFIVCAFNEEECITKKINNTTSLNYPKDKIEYIFITDGSVDDTMKIISGHPEIMHLHQDERKGKSAALNRAVESATGEILVFSDANTLLNIDSLKYLTRHYTDNKIGAVSGEKIVSSDDNEGDVKSEGLYWKYESFLKKIDSDCYSVVGAAGELFSLRSSLFEPVSSDAILDDFIISMKIALKGYRIKYEPKAYAKETPSFSIKDEQKRKIRIAAGGFQAISYLTPALKFWKHPKLSFLYISHRVLRWAVSPFCLVFAFFSSFILFVNSYNLIASCLFLLQVFFYFFAYFGYAFTSLSKSKFFQIPYYFVFMNISVFFGFFRFLKGKQSAIWEKVKRRS